MALTNLIHKPYPSGRNVYCWEIRDTRIGIRPISRHKYLGFAMLEAERLNRLAQERESKVVCITKGQLSERELSDAHIRGLQDACGVNRKPWEE
jgi:hypothetical protein